jgi:hypothetical protein
VPDERELTKEAIWGLYLVQGFFGALLKGRGWSFIESDEVRRFLHQAKRGSFGEKIPDGGTPGSEIPGTGTQDPLDVLAGLFSGIGSSLGEVDRPGRAGKDRKPDGPSVLPDGTHQTIHTDAETGDRVTIRRYADGSISTWTAHRDGSADGFRWFPDNHTAMFHVDHTPNGSTEFGAGFHESGTGVETHPGGNAREVVTNSFHWHNGTVHQDGPPRVWRRENSPGEDGREANSDRNPLANLETIGPHSLAQMTEALRHPAKDVDLDPNTGRKGPQFTDADKERLGRIVPNADLLDPNSGVNPLAALNLDPSRMHTRSEDDDRVDPNTGLKPQPGGK